MRYKDFNQIEISHIYDNGARIRNKIININDVNKYIGMKEIHISVGRFKNLTEYMKINGSISGIDSYKIDIFYDYVIIDYDSFDVEKLKKFIISFCKYFDVDIKYIKLFFSGNKGFHVYIPSSLMIVEPSDILNLIVGKFVSLITENIIDVDMNIYRKNSMIRLPNTLNTKSNLYKIPIYFDELDDIDNIRQMARNTRIIKTEYPNFSNQKLMDYFNNIKISKKSVSYNNNNSSNAKKCIVKMLGGGCKDERGGRKNIAFRLAVHFANEGIPSDLTEVLMLEWNNKNIPPLSPNIIRSVIKSAYNNKYDFGCNDPIKTMNCDKSCFLYKYKTGDINE